MTTSRSDFTMGDGDTVTSTETSESPSFHTALKPLPNSEPSRLRKDKKYIEEDRLTS